MTAEPAPGLRVDVRRGHPTEEELAAVIAVVTTGYVEESEDARADETRRSRWEISQRGLRSPLRRDLGWGGFSG
ncbi:acyl-CoA carboxylase subunit epsilon [Microbacterium sp. cx-55]|uniref:acyl-CoA carboxylase subunit epsilon n=1 Tax=Microbacterium sp. cx-55 TaxID=2875948 RepID=UPI001CC0ED41|nr:acyl-CoA carboxylase subunit epsilon [Microbacterium sp. cx-55]MBZ4487072.1 acyl-CoA carboxylase subunit epsilon [Microbacterium sp. cx-55]UGB35988.1 acyl-CoA carboxylase subunit epsilon [Microbacterium sp. cx-55]